MTTSLDSLLTPQTPAQLEAQLLTALAANGLPTTSWQPGSVPTAFLKTDAQVLSEHDATIAQIARGGFVEYATGDWLTLLARNRYGLERLPATYAEGFVTLTVAAGVASPGMKPPGSIIVASAGNPALRFISTAPVTLPSGGVGGASATVAVRAEQAGATYSNRTDLTILNTAIPGVTVASFGATTGGTDEQSDQSLAAACEARWATLGTGATPAVYRLWAFYAVDADGEGAGITEATAEQSPAGTGGVKVYVSSNGGGVSPEKVAIVQAYIDERVPIGSEPSVESVEVITVTITGTIYATAAAVATCKALANNALIAYAQTQVPGGEPIGEPSPGDYGVSFERIASLFMSVTGIQNLVGVTVSAPGAVVTASNDIVLAKNQVVTFDISAMNVAQAG